MKLILKDENLLGMFLIKKREAVLLSNTKADHNIIINPELLKEQIMKKGSPQSKRRGLRLPN